MEVQKNIIIIRSRFGSLLFIFRIQKLTPILEEEIGVSNAPSTELLHPNPPAEIHTKASWHTALPNQWKYPPQIGLGLKTPKGKMVPFNLLGPIP